MTDLTEKWKKGELLEGFYFVKCDWSDEVEIRYVHNGVDDWREVLAPVPSYEEWKRAYECVVSENEEIITLKELLKECIPALVRFVSYDDSEENARILLMNKINEVLK